MSTSQMNTYSGDLQWFAVWTRSRQEKTAASLLEASGVIHFLPLKSEFHQWSDRKQAVTVPLFSSYLFVRTNMAKDSRLKVLNASGIAGFVGNSKGPTPIPDEQIEVIRKVLAREVKCNVIPLLEKGEQVRIVRGPLAGIQGTFLQSNSIAQVAISIEMIHKSIVVSILANDVERIEPTAL